MKKVFIAVMMSLPLIAHAEISPETQSKLAERIADASFGEGDYANTMAKARVMGALDNVKGICGENSVNEAAKISVAVQKMLAEENYFVTPLEIIEAIGTLKRQAPDGVDCMQVGIDYAKTVKVAPTPTEALASVNSLYKITKQLDKESKK